MAEYEKIKRVTYPLEADHLLLVRTEVDGGHMSIIDRILKQLSE